MHVVHSAVPDSRRRERVSLCATVRSGCGQCDSAWVRAVRQRTHPQSRRSRRRRRPTSPSLSDRVVSWRLTERVVRSLSVGAGEKKRTVLLPCSLTCSSPSVNTQFCNTRLAGPWYNVCSQRKVKPTDFYNGWRRAPKSLVVQPPCGRVRQELRSIFRTAATRCTLAAGAPACCLPLAVSSSRRTHPLTCTERPLRRRCASSTSSASGTRTAAAP